MGNEAVLHAMILLLLANTAWLVRLLNADMQTDDAKKNYLQTVRDGMASDWRAFMEVSWPYRWATCLLAPIGVVVFFHGISNRSHLPALLALLLAGVGPPFFYALMRVFGKDDQSKESAKLAGEIWAPFWVAVTAFGVLVYQARCFGSQAGCT